MERILILGGGFGGVAAAVTLKEQLGDDVEVKVVSKRPYFMVGFRKSWAMLDIAPYVHTGVLEGRQQFLRSTCAGDDGRDLRS